MIATGTHVLLDGRAVDVVEIAGGGLRARVATLGAAVLNLWVPADDGGSADVVLGHADLASYVGDPAFLGLAIGPVAGRIGHAQVTVNGDRYTLDANDGPNTLHSGPSGLHGVVWDLAEVGPDRTVLTTTRLDGAGGFPGPLSVQLAVTLADGALVLEWQAEAERATPFAPTHHLYVHPDGHDAGTVRGLGVQSDAPRLVELGPDSVPTGRVLPVDGTPFDLTGGAAIGEVLDADHPQVAVAGGLDHDLTWPGHRHRPLRQVALVEGELRALEVWTTEPGVHLYAGGFLDVDGGKGGARYGPFNGLALETQPPPDAVAHPAFPDIVLQPGQSFRSRTEYRFP